MTPYYSDDAVTLYHGDCLAVLGGMADDSIDAVVTDPPYGLAFMGKKWDYDTPCVDIWRECLRVLKPGGHLLSFAGTRTQHRMACAIEDAGFEIRDMIAWVYGSGFPKSLDVSKAIDKAAGAEREVVGLERTPWKGSSASVTGVHGDAYRPTGDDGYVTKPITAPATPDAERWQGWGTALKPAFEPVVVARKPLTGTVAQNVLAHGTGALNIDGCRVGSQVAGHRTNGQANEVYGDLSYTAGERWEGNPAGRWPANLIHDGSEEVAGLFPVTAAGNRPAVRNTSGVFTANAQGETGDGMRMDSGSAARFFYCAKASKRDRDEGCEGIEERKSGMSNGAQTHGDGYDKGQDIGLNRVVARRNHHPTVKPTDLMRYLCRLVTPPGGTVLDPFMGSGSTGKAAVLEGFGFIGIEREAEYVEIAKARIENAKKKYPLRV